MVSQPRRSSHATTSLPMHAQQRVGRGGAVLAWHKERAAALHARSAPPPAPPSPDSGDGGLALGALQVACNLTLMRDGDADGFGGSQTPMGGGLVTIQWWELRCWVVDAQGSPVDTEGGGPTNSGTAKASHANASRSKGPSSAPPVVSCSNEMQVRAARG
jgi:hypothetical protein